MIATAEQSTSLNEIAFGDFLAERLIWLVAGALLLSYCIFRNDTLFTFVQVINITAIMAMIILARRGNRICPYHLKMALGSADQNQMVKRAA